MCKHRGKNWRKEDRKQNKKSEKKKGGGGCLFKRVKDLKKRVVRQILK